MFSPKHFSLPSVYAYGDIMKPLRVALSTSLYLAIMAVCFAASVDPPKAPPGAEIDLRTATALADQIIVGTISRVGPSRPCSGTGMQYADVTVDAEQSLKGDNPAQITCIVGTPDETAEGKKLPPQHLPTSGRYILFVSKERQDGDVRYGFKLEPATPEAIAQVNGYFSQLPTTRQIEREISQATTRPGDLIAEIIVPEKIPPGDSLKAKLRLTNHSSAPIRICTLGQWWRGFDAGTRLSEAHLTAGRFMSVTPPAVEFAKCIHAIDPEKSFDIPIDFFIGEGLGQVRLTAQYTAMADIAQKLDIWAGSVSSGPITVNH